MTNAKKDFTRIGLALFVMAALTMALQSGVSYLFSYTSLGYVAMKYELVAWLGQFLPLYLVGVPVSLLIMKNVEREKLEKSKLGVGTTIMYFIMCIGLFYGGNIIGNVISSVLSSGTSQNAVADLAINSGNVKLIFMVICAPIIEELVFRKAIIDRVGKYGEKFAIVYSALAFGLFHMNLFQFFYAFFLGLMFGYIYSRTRNILYTIGFHMVVNTIGSVLAPFFLSKIDAAALDEIAMGTASTEAITAALPGLMMFGTYVLILLVLAVTGLILLIVKRKSFEYRTSSQELQKGEFAKAAYMNYGYILFAAFCIVFILYTLLIGLFI